MSKLYTGTGYRSKHEVVFAAQAVPNLKLESNKRNNPDVDSSGWDSPDIMVKAAIFLAAQDASGVIGVVAHDEQIIRWHGLL
jgi:hypothetical protein